MSNPDRIVRRAAGSARFPAALALAAALIDGATIRADCTGVAPVSNTTLTSIPVVTGLTGRPLFVTAPPGDRDRLFIVEQDGRIRIKKRGDPPGTHPVFLDVTSRVQASLQRNEMGLLGLAFDPDYAVNRRFYINYTEGLLNGPWSTVVARYEATPGDPDTAVFASEQRLLVFAQPQANHNGGQILFGPDGYLHIATGDGGGAGDAHGACGNGQNLSTMLGKFLRVDVRGIDPMGTAPDCGGASAGYTIPSDNPFRDGAGGACDEVWAYGLRNPWRIAFDDLTGDFYSGDVGQDCYEEINFAGAATAAGRNYGWRQMEGRHCFDPANRFNCNASGVACAGSPACQDPGLTLPIVEYAQAAGGCSVTGGVVYRGCQMPGFSGRYFYGDFCDGFVRSFRVVGGAAVDPVDYTTALGPGGALTNSLTSFGSDADGEMYIVDRDGTILRVAPPFTDLEVSGPGAAVPLTLDPATWAWEDLAFSTMHPVSTYRVFRGQPGGDFRCVHASASPEWTGGDPEDPAVGAMFAYIVTAVNPSGQQTRSGDPSHTLLPNACP